MDARLKDTRWDKKFEDTLWKTWRNQKRKPGKAANVFSIDTPPPYVNSPIHIGHATTYTLMDMFARFHRMKGEQVLFPLGLDNNGLPIEMAAEKKFGKKFSEVSRKEFIDLCRQMLQDAGTTSVDSFAKLGISFSNYEPGTEIGDSYATDSDTYRALTQNTFIDLWNKGLIYEDERLNNYCPGCKTTIADSEIERKEKPGLLNFVHFKIKGSKETAIIATTRPELLCTAAVAIYNPSDERYKHLKGKKLITPVFGNEIEVFEDDEADPKFGTGLVYMSASAGDQDAIRFLRKRNIKPIPAIGTDGTMLDIAGPLKGLHTKKAREKVIAMMQEKGEIEKQVQFTHSVPVCERSGDVIEFIAMKEFYLKQVEFKADMRRVAHDIKFHADSSRQLLIDWIQGVSMDWPISRRRYYATEIPLWYCQKCNVPYVPPKGKYYKPWCESPPVKKCPKCNHGEFRGETRVFDTWFDSSISPLYILGYERHPEFYKSNPVCTMRPQGKEIVRTWLYYTLLKCKLLTNKAMFKDAWIHFHVVDEKGYKMSKSKGNGIDPQEIITKFGAEPFRLWCAVEGDITNTDLRCSFDRIDGAGKTLTKLWNVARFISMFPEPKGKAVLLDTDKWILNEIAAIINQADESFAKYDFHTPALALRNFIWETFASHYLELVKTRAYNESGQFTKEEQNGALQTLNTVLELILRLLAPIVPFITYTIYHELWKKDVHSLKFPDAPEEHEIPFKKEDITALNSAIWKMKKDAGQSLKSPIESIEVDERLASVQKDLVAAHTIKKVVLVQN